jgi:PAS domain S-box-containing protein
VSCKPILKGQIEQCLHYRESVPERRTGMQGRHCEGRLVNGRVESEEGLSRERPARSNGPAARELRADEAPHPENDELKKNRNLLEGALRHYKELFDKAPDAYIVTDNEGIIREANFAAARLLDLRLDRMIGASLASFISGPERRRFRLTVGRVASGEKPPGDDGEWLLKLRQRGSEVVEAASTVAPVHDSQGNLVSLRWILRDVTSRMRAEERTRTLNMHLEQQLKQRTAALAAANWAKAEFLAVMAHELRTPLNAILGYAELMEMGLSGPVTDVQASHLARIRSGGIRLVGLIDEVLDLGKVEAGQLRITHEELPVLTAVNSALTLVIPQAASRGVRVENECSLNPHVSYVGDQTRLEQILVNLLSNAIKFTPSGGTVSTSCDVRARAKGNERLSEARGPWVALRVSDTGIGMASQLLSRVFEPFVQVESPLTRTKGGTGLGLTISRRLARLMGGDLTVESEEGVGSTFTIWLPAPEGALGDREKPKERRGPERYARGIARLGELLLVELDAIVRTYAKRLSGRSGVKRAVDLSRSELEDHAAAFLAEIIQSLVIVEEAEGKASGMMRDGSVLRKVVSERHGAHRKRLAWTEDELRREFDIVRSTVFAALRRVARESEDVGVQEQRRAAQALLAKLLDGAEQASLRGYRLAALEGSRKIVATS